MQLQIWTVTGINWLQLEYTGLKKKLIQGEQEHTVMSKQDKVTDEWN